MSSLEFRNEWEANYHESNETVFMSLYSWVKDLNDKDPFNIGEIAHREWKSLTVAEATQLRDALDHALAQAKANA